MSERFEINENDLEEVTGGSLIWGRQGVYCKENPTTTYGFKSYSACRAWIQENWKGKPQDNSLLQTLEQEGLIYAK
jgi:hypothetical protein